VAAPQAAYAEAQGGVPIKKPKIALILSLTAGFVVLAAAALLFVFFIYLPGSRYGNAEKLFNEERYGEALAALGELSPDYKDVDDLTPYYEAYSVYGQGDYREAAELFDDLGHYQDARKMRDECRYLYANELLDGGDYGEAAELFDSLNVKDSAELAKECRYRQATDLMLNDAENARELFAGLGDYKDSADKTLACDYYIATQVLENGDFSGAYAAFSALGGYADSVEMLTECEYRAALAMYNEGDYEEAEERFREIADYKDSAELLEQCLALITEEIYAEYLESQLITADSESMIDGTYWVENQRTFDFDGDGVQDFYYLLHNGEDFLSGFCTVSNGYVAELLSGFGGPYGYEAQIAAAYHLELNEYVLGYAWGTEDEYGCTFFSMENGQLTQLDNFYIYFSYGDYNDLTGEWEDTAYYYVNDIEVSGEAYYDYEYMYYDINYNFSAFLETW
jgi:TolA-binding protein